MKDAEIEEQFRLLHQEVVLAGEAVDSFQRNHRAEIDALRLEVEVLRRCLIRLHPEMAEHYETLRSEIVQETDPETV